MVVVRQRKFGGHLAVCVGSGATHLINGFDAVMDNIPVVAILGFRPQKN